MPPSDVLIYPVVFLLVCQLLNQSFFYMVYEINQIIKYVIYS